MKRFVRTYLAFLGTARKAWWTAGVLAAMVVGSASVCVAQPEDGAQRTEERTEEHDELLASRGFYRRQAAGQGWFLTRSDPEVARSRTLSDVLRTVPGLKTLGEAGAAQSVSARQPGRCPMAVYVDGAYTTIRNVDELTLDHIQALEVYRGPSEVPLAYTAPTYEGTCGALLVWSRIDLDEE
jgi:outer membrane receptor for ferrienterochelin and colicin